MNGILGGQMLSLSSLLTDPLAEQHNIVKDTIPASKNKDPNDIWEDDEDLVVMDLDPRPAPEQSVSSEDMYLGMTGKSPSINDSDCLLVKITLPNTKLVDIVLNCTDTAVECTTANFKLSVSLPKKVNSELGVAFWDQAKEFMTITLPIVSEYTF